MLTCLLLAAMASSAKADDILFRPTGPISAVTERSLTFEAPGITGSCNVTLSGSFSSRSITATAGNTVGDITQVRWASCSGGSIRAVLSLPWNIKYEAVLGSMSETVSGFLFTIARAKFQVSAFFELVTCLYEGGIRTLTATTPDGGLEAAWVFRTLRVQEAGRLAFVSGSESCPEAVTPRGTFVLSIPEQVRRRQARMSSFITAMPLGTRETTLRIYNPAPVGEPELRVEEVRVDMLGGGNPEMFEIRAETNICRGALIPAGFVSYCLAIVRYTGLETARPKTARGLIRRNNTIDILETPFNITASG